MKKIIYIVAGILIVASVVLVVIYRNRTVAPESSQPLATPVQIPSLPSAAELREQGKAAVPAGSENIVINDPYKNALKIVSGNADMKKTPDYEIVYLGVMKSFVITLYGENLSDSRNKAEQAFLESLGIAKDAACKLNVTLAVAPEANKNAAGKNYGLSFCPQGKSLPGN